jgi:hypothetical protein
MGWVAVGAGVTQIFQRFTDHGMQWDNSANSHVGPLGFVQRKTPHRGDAGLVFGRSDYAFLAAE